MRLKKYVFLLMISIFFFCFFVLMHEKSQKLPPSQPPVFSKPEVLVPSAPSKKTIGSDPLIIDISNQDYGYITAISNSASRINIQLSDPDNITYFYFLEEHETAVLPLTSGNGKYILSCYQQVIDEQYAALYSHILDVTLKNEFYPFLYPNQYVNFSPETKACILAQSFFTDDISDIELLDLIYNYVTQQISYDYDKAKTIQPRYLPDINETLNSQKGICFDYAALITAMLRSCDIPCKLQIGYSGEVKHAWIDVYIRSKGWINKAIFFDNDAWGRLDPTFDSNSNDTKTSIASYIGDASNYTVQFTR